MTLEEAARLLREMYDDPRTGKAVSVHLFGIRYAEALQDMSLQDIAVRAGISKSYGTEIAKGRTLARYVVER